MDLFHIRVENTKIIMFITMKKERNLLVHQGQPNTGKSLALILEIQAMKG